MQAEAAPLKHLGYNPGDLFSETVTYVIEEGFFVECGPFRGFCHISAIWDENAGQDVRHYFTAGMRVKLAFIGYGPQLGQFRCNWTKANSGSPKRLPETEGSLAADRPASSPKPVPEAEIVRPSPSPPAAEIVRRSPSPPAAEIVRRSPSPPAADSVRPSPSPPAARATAPLADPLPRQLAPPGRPAPPAPRGALPPPQPLHKPGDATESVQNLMLEFVGRAALALGMKDPARHSASEECILNGWRYLCSGRVDLAMTVLKTYIDQHRL